MSSDRLKSLFLALIVAAGCSVKEDRTDCPCYLTLDWTEVDCWKMMDAGHSSVRWSVTARGGIWHQEGELPLETLEPFTELQVPKDSVTVTAACGAEIDPLVGVVADENGTFPRLYYHSGIVDASSAMASDTILLHREHAELFLYVKNIMQPGASYTVRGNIVGCDLSGAPVPGSFSSSVKVDGRGLGSVVLPRQADSSLWLDVSYAGELVRSLAIGEYIIASGYDWTAENLEDIVMEIDYYQTKVVVSIEQWKKTLTFTIVF